MTIKTNIPGYKGTERISSKMSWMLKNLSPYLRQSGNQWRPRWYLGPRKLLDYLLVFNGSGKGIFTVGKSTFDLNAGELVIIPPDTIHSMRGVSEKMHCMYIHFDLIYDPERSNWDAFIPEGTTDLSKFKEFMHPPVNEYLSKIMSDKIRLEKPELVKIYLEKLCNLHTGTEEVGIISSSGVILELIAEICKQVNYTQKDHYINYRKIIAAGNYINKNPEKSITVKELAQKSSLSEPHFRKLFKKIHGASPKKMIQQSKIRKACELLSYWNMNVSEVAETLNFNSIYTFSRSFKNITGVPPTEYLKTPIKKQPD
jgi:AraC-like DNA-binding protein